MYVHVFERQHFWSVIVNAHVCTYTIQCAKPTPSTIKVRPSSWDFFSKKKIFCRKKWSLVSLLHEWNSSVYRETNLSAKVCQRKARTYRQTNRKKTKTEAEWGKVNSKEGDRCLENSSKDFAWFWPTVLVLSKPVVSFLSKSSSSEKKSLESNQQIFQGGEK
jgi:hypothetical protein